MDYTQWCKSPELQAELRQILNHPTFRIALAIVKESGLPLMNACPFENCTFLEWQAGKAFYSQGYFDHDRNLVAMANVPEAHVVSARADSRPVLGPWEFYRTDADKKAKAAGEAKPLRPAPPLKKSPRTPKPTPKKKPTTK